MKPLSKITKAASLPGARLPAQDLAQVRAIAATVPARTLFERNALLFVGTNATAAAEAMVKEMRRDLYRVDLSSIVSRYIGETEKNLRRVFAEAAAANAILLLDEADALFGKRADVKDAHDRYSNLELDSLLRILDGYDGLVVIASKPRLALAMKLKRRFSIYDFPPPNRRVAKTAARQLRWMRA